MLVEGVTDARDAGGKKLYFLRRIPRDPFHVDGATPAEQTWALRAYASEPDDFSGGDDVYDVRSKSELIGLNGAAVAQW